MEAVLDNATLNDLAREACELHNAIEDAVAYMLQRLDADPELKMQLLEQMVRMACQRAIYSRRYKDRPRPTQNPPRVTAEAIDANAVVAVKTLLDFTMPDGRTLGGWTGSELLGQAPKDRAVGRGYFHRAAFFELVGKAAGERMVRACMTAPELEGLWKKACSKASRGQIPSVTQRRSASDLAKAAG